MKTVLGTAVACLLAAGSYMVPPMLSGELLFDDMVSVVDNTDVTDHSTPLRGILSNDFWGRPITDERSHKSFRPFTVATYRANHYFTGLDPFPFHAINVLLHVINTALLTRFAGLLFGPSKRLESAFCGALFAVHPLNSEAVCYVTGRADLLAAMWLLISVVAYAKACGGGGGDPSFDSITPSDARAPVETSTGGGSGGSAYPDASAADGADANAHTAAGPDPDDRDGHPTLPLPTPADNSSAPASSFSSPSSSTTSSPKSSSSSTSYSSSSHPSPSCSTSSPSSCSTATAAAWLSLSVLSAALATVCKETGAVSFAAAVAYEVCQLETPPPPHPASRYYSLHLPTHCLDAVLTAHDDVDYDGHNCDVWTPGSSSAVAGTTCLWPASACAFF
jgi:hypothetical protein